MSGLRLARVARLGTLSSTRSNALRAIGSTRSASTSTNSGSNALRTGLYTTVFVVSTGLFAAYYFDSRSAIHRYVFNPIIRYTLDPEAGHKLAVKVLRSGLGPRDTQADDESLKLNVRASFHL
jgi:dihydroorotate dehydrogenase